MIGERQASKSSMNMLLSLFWIPLAAAGLFLATGAGAQNENESPASNLQEEAPETQASDAADFEATDAGVPVQDKDNIALGRERVKLAAAWRCIERAKGGVNPAMKGVDIAWLDLGIMARNDERFNPAPHLRLLDSQLDVSIVQYSRGDTGLNESDRKRLLASIKRTKNMLAPVLGKYQDGDVLATVGQLKTELRKVLATERALIAASDDIEAGQFIGEGARERKPPLGGSDDKSSKEVNRLACVADCTEVCGAGGHLFGGNYRCRSACVNSCNGIR